MNQKYYWIFFIIIIISIILISGCVQRIISNKDLIKDCEWLKNISFEKDVNIDTISDCISQDFFIDNNVIKVFSFNHCPKGIGRCLVDREGGGGYAYWPEPYHGLIIDEEVYSLNKQLNGIEIEKVLEMINVDLLFKIKNKIEDISEFRLLLASLHEYIARIYFLNQEKINLIPKEEFTKVWMFNLAKYIKDPNLCINISHKPTKFFCFQKLIKPFSTSKIQELDDKVISKELCFDIKSSFMEIEDNYKKWYDEHHRVNLNNEMIKTFNICIRYVAEKEKNPEICDYLLEDLELSGSLDFQKRYCKLNLQTKK